MNELKTDWRIDYDSARLLSVKAASVFQPRTPIATREFFAGRINQITILADAVGQIGLHVVIYGERGVGKTSLANVVKAITEVFDARDSDIRTVPKNRVVVKQNANSGDNFSSIWNKLFEDVTTAGPVVGIATRVGGPVPIKEAFDMPEMLTVDHVRRALSKMPGSVFIVDEFDTATDSTRHQFTDLIKALSDLAVDCTIILVGVSDTVDRLVLDHASISRCLVQILLPRMVERELDEIITKAEHILPIKFADDARHLIVHVSQGLPHYTHLISLHTVRISATKHFSRFIERSVVFEALKEAVRQAQQTVTDAHCMAIHSAHKDALYRHVLLACALAAAECHDALGYFSPGSVVEPLSKILGRDVQIATFSNHLGEFAGEKRGNVLEREGQPRSYRFRFSDPLLVPFVFMDAVANGIVDERQLAALLTGRSFRPT